MTSTFPRWENDVEPAFVFELSRRLCSFFNVTVLAPRSPGSKDSENMYGMQVIRFPYFFRRWENLATHSGGILSRLRANPFNYLLVPLFLFGQLWALVSLLRLEQFALIHAHWLIPQGFIAIIAKTLVRQPIPLVSTSHGSDLFALRGSIFQSLKIWVIKSSAVVTVVSRAMKEIVEGMGVTKDNVKVISMGVDLKHRFTPDPTVERKDRELLFVGRLVENKGLSILVKAMPKVISLYPDVHLTVAGSGPLEVELNGLVRQLNLEDHVTFLGMVPQSQLPALYRKATLAVFPFLVAKTGEQEGFGLVQVEAMGCGCPVIVGDLPAIHDTVKHGERGLLVKPGDPEALADTIMGALADPFLCERMASKARKNVIEDYDWEIIAKQYLQIYDQVIKENVLDRTNKH